MSAEALTAELVAAYAAQHLQPVRSPSGRWVIPGAQIEAVHAHFGTTIRGYLDDEDLGARLVGDATSRVKARLLEAAERHDERTHR